MIGALGVLAKYSVLALPASVGLFLLLSPRHRRQLLRPGFWMMAVALRRARTWRRSCIWNAQHGWAGAGQLADRVGLSDRATWGSLWPVLGFLGGEAAVLGGIWWIAGLAAIKARCATCCRPADDPNPAATRTLVIRDRPSLDRDGALYLLCLWGVLWCACLAASILGETEANWMAPGYVAVVVLIGWRMARIFAVGGARARVYVAAWCVCARRGRRDPSHRLVLPDRCPIRARSLGAVGGTPALCDVTARMRGHQELARAVERQRRRPPGPGCHAVRRHADLCPDLDAGVLSAGPARDLLSGLELRHDPRPVNQHDLWHPNPRNDPAPFLGRPIVVVEDANMPPNYAMLLLPQAGRRPHRAGRAGRGPRAWRHRRRLGHHRLPRLPRHRRLQAESVLAAGRSPCPPCCRGARAETILIRLHHSRLIG